MQFSSMAHVLGLVGVTPVRAFLPAFLTALAIRIGGIPYLTDAATADAAAAPSWFTNTYTLVALGLLSLLEFFATRSPEARQLLSTIDEYYKPALAALTSLGLLSASDVIAVETLHGGIVHSSMFPIAAITFGTGLSSVLFSLFTTGGTYFACTVRSAVMSLVDDIDADNSMGLQSLISWAEDAWVAVLAVLLVLVPILIFFLVAVSLFGLWLLRKHLDRRAEKSKVECAACRAKVFPFATVCYNCRSSLKNVVSIGFLGQSQTDLARDLASHRLKLMSLRKCPSCGCRLKKKTVHQTCESCSHPLASSDNLPDSYLAMVRSRLPQSLLICGLLSAVPIVGMIPAIVYYRVSLVSPFRGYIGLGSSFLSRWGAGIVGILLVAFFSWVPIFSTFVAPALAYMNYAIYRHAFVAQWEQEKRSEALAAKPPPTKAVKRRNAGTQG